MAVRWLPAAAVALLTMALIAFLPRPLTSDVMGQLWIARALRHGARLYVDIAEINPPLWFWMAVPVDRLAAHFYVPADGALIAACGLAALASIVATGRVLASMPHRTAFLVYAALILLVAPLRDTAQREAIVAMAALPYAALAARRGEERGEGRGVPRWLAMLVGVGAGAAFALKPYFLAVPLLIEGWLIVSLRRDWRPFRAETLSLAAVGVIYAAAVAIVTPAYLTDTIPLLRLAYIGKGVPWRAMILPAQFVWLLTAAVIASQHRRLRDAPLAVALSLAAAGFAAAWAIQHKGWPYHSIPATATLALALAALLAQARVGAVARRAAVAALVLPLTLATMPTHAPMTGENDIAPLLAGLRRGDPVGLISTEGFTAWPAMTDGAYRPASRHLQYWMLATLDARDPRVAAFGRRVVRETARDWRCLPPRRIVVAQPRPGGDAAEDPLPRFLRDPAFAAVFARYRPWRRHGIFTAYVPSTPIVAPPPDGCRRAA